MLREDALWMREALAEAQRCLRAPLGRDDVPIGAICVRDGVIVGRGHNRREEWNDPTAHAEVLALRDAANHTGSSHLKDVTLYVTLEPCAMCAGAIWLARVERVVFGAWDAKAGACGSVFDIPREPRLNHQPQLRGGILENECAQLLTDFFRRKREPDKQQSGDS